MKVNSVVDAEGEGIANAKGDGAEAEADADLAAKVDINRALAEDGNARANDDGKPAVTATKSATS
jgi:hypothetical protein